MSRNTTIGATQRKIEELGYAIGSTTNLDRTQGMTFADCGRRRQLWSMRDDPAGVLTYPTAYWAPELKHEPNAALNRGIVLLIVTAYLQSDPRQLKAVMPILERYKLTSGPVRTDDFGNKTYPLQWNVREPILKDNAARSAHPDDDATVIFKQQAIPSRRYDYRQNHMGISCQVPLDEIGSHILPLGGEWKQGHLLDTPRRNLPELFECDVSEIIADVERARWGARPAAVSKEAA